MIDSDVAASQGAARWSVAECGWKKLLPDLPDDVSALLAPPVVVSASAGARTVRRTSGRTVPRATAQAA